MVLFIAIGLGIGLLASVLARARGTDFVGYTIVGVTGASSAGMLSGALGVHSLWGSALTACAGAILFLALIEVMKRS